MERRPRARDRWEYTNPKFLATLPPAHENLAVTVLIGSDDYFRGFFGVLRVGLCLVLDCARFGDIAEGDYAIDQSPWFQKALAADAGARQNARLLVPPAITDSTSTTDHLVLKLRPFRPFPHPPALPWSAARRRPPPPASLPALTPPAQSHPSPPSLPPSVVKTPYIYDQYRTERHSSGLAWLFLVCLTGR